MLETNNAFVFVGGLHRSGTSLVSRAIASHPEVSAFADTGVPEDESQHLQSVFPPAIRYGAPGNFSWLLRASYSRLPRHYGYTR